MKRSIDAAFEIFNVPRPARRGVLFPSRKHQLIEMHARRGRRLAYNAHEHNFRVALLKK